jgi:glycerophosphoryl diester phosphodiesterase
MAHGSLAIGVHGGTDAAPLVVAHRGAWDQSVPQNSLEAFERAIEAGADAIELDVRRTADGRLAVVHDARVGGRPVGGLSDAELRARVKDGQAPPLEQALELVAGRIAVDVELKEDGYVEQAITAIRRRLTPDQYVVTSFRDTVLPAVKRVEPDARTGLLLSPRRHVGELDRRVSTTGVDFLAPHARLSRLGLLNWAAERGLPTWVWTVNERRALRQHLEDPRVAAVITDRLDRALPLANRSMEPIANFTNS